MAPTSRAVGVAGSGLAIASFLMVLVFAFHGPIAPEPAEQMQRIADGAMRWYIVHWLAALALSLYAMSSLIVLASGSRLTDRAWTLTAWAALPVAALWTVTTFSEGNANGFAVFALAIAAIAAGEARNPRRVTPAWAAWLAVLAGVASFAGWALGMWFSVGAGNLLWVAASLLMSAWILWFGVGLARPGASVDAAADTRAAISGKVAG